MQESKKRRFFAPFHAFVVSRIVGQQEIRLARSLVLDFVLFDYFINRQVPVVGQITRRTLPSRTFLQIPEHIARLR